MAELIRFDEADPVARGDGIESVRLTPTPLEGQGFTMGVTSFPPGDQHPSPQPQHHRTGDGARGEGLAELNGEQVAAGPTTRPRSPPGSGTGSSTPGPGR